MSQTLEKEKVKLVKLEVGKVFLARKKERLIADINNIFCVKFFILPIKAVCEQN